MTKFNFRAGQRACMILAHPDDETIWLSGTVMLHPDIDWTLLCLSRASDQDRAPKFRRVADHLGITAYQEDLDDLERWPFQKHVKAVKELAKKYFSRERFDFIVTHGANGEYGHRDHKSVHEAVNDLFTRGILKADYLLCLHYKRPRKKSPLMIPRAQADLLVNLPSDICAEKLRIMTRLYGFDAQGIDANLCTKVEAFSIKQYN